MPRFMLDTDTSSYVIKRSVPPVLRRLQSVPIGDVCISVVTMAELLYGVLLSPRREQDRAAVDAFLRHLAVLEFPENAAAHYAEIRAELKRRSELIGGELIGANDLLIAAHARCRGLVLVTNNTREFGRVPGLALENWAAG